MRPQLYAALAGALLFAGPALAQGISGTAHDLRTTLSIGEICLPCHAPHTSNTGATVPLFNHDEPAGPFTVRAGGAVSAGTSTAACLGCHDGVTSIDAYGGGANTSVLMTGSKMLGTDLTGDHPVGVTLVDDADYDIPTLVSLEGGDVECGVCHDPHNNGTPKFLEVANTNSQLCLDCHNQ